MPLAAGGAVALAPARTRTGLAPALRAAAEAVESRTPNT